MKPLFFGSANRKLYGVYHPAVGPRPQSRGAQGVVLCYPGVQEYNVSHSAFRKLSGLLSRAGLHVLRFDYFGTGDSAGEMDEGTPEDWVEDVRTAVAELTDLAGIRLVSLVGYRLGAALATLAVARGLKVEDLVLWDPVVDGRDYVTDLEFRDRQQNLLLIHANSGFLRGKDEILGFPFTPTLRSALGKLDLRKLDTATARRVVVMATEQRKEYSDLHAALASVRGVSYSFVPEDADAQNRGAREEILLVTKILGAIRDEMTGAPS
jgi:pimeloyl-ACP methyl ester carboxylesterase